MVLRGSCLAPMWLHSVVADCVHLKQQPQLKEMCGKKGCMVFICSPCLALVLEEELPAKSLPVQFLVV